jgi:hypothetical protein
MGVRTLKVVNNDFVFANDRLTQISGIEALTQIVGNRLKLWLGEWFAAVDSGIDYLGIFNLSKNTPIEKRVRIIFRQAILADPRVEKLEEMTIDLNKSTREITIDFVAIADGEKLVDTITISP